MTRRRQAAVSQETANLSPRALERELQRLCHASVRGRRPCAVFLYPLAGFLGAALVRRSLFSFWTHQRCVGPQARRLIMAMKRCRECKEKVSKKERACPHCGIKLKRRSKLGGLFMSLILGVVFLAIIGAMFGEHEPPAVQAKGNRQDLATQSSNLTNQSVSQLEPISVPRTRSTPKRQQWYQGGTLHKSTLGQWAQAPYRDCLATASDFVVTMLKHEGKQPRNIDELKSLAIDLEVCITTTRGDGELDQLAVAEVSAACWILLGNGAAQK
jgi:hypothetical protein